uniref:Uncharacterized protein n=1 Tax=Cacopsylla melanoneura TaxID=428564 RepID=A0A8D8X7F3_9HEMI
MRSTIEYGSVLWTPRTINDKKTIENLQARFIRYLFQKANGFYPKYPENISYKTLIENLPIESIEDRFTKIQMKFLEDTIKHNIDSPYILAQLKFKVPYRRIRPDPTQLFSIKKSKFKFPC